MLSWIAALIIPAELIRAGGTIIEATAADGGSLVASLRPAGPPGSGMMGAEVVYTPPEPSGEGYTPCRFPTFPEVYSALAAMDPSGIYNIQVSAFHGAPEPGGWPHASIVMLKVGEIIKESQHGQEKKSN